MDKETKSEDNSIEEDIEEALSGELSGGAISDDKEAVKLANIAAKKQKLFDIDDDDRFTIDDDQLSGGKLAQHFQVVGDAPTSRSSRRSKTKKISKKEASGHKQSENPPSLTNQSTANDVSELADENSIEPNELYIRSLDLGYNDVSYQPRGCQSLDTAVKVNLPKELSLISNQDGNDEKDHSLEEIMESNHSVEATLDSKNLSSLGPEIDINNESQINKILNDTSNDMLDKTLIEEPVSTATDSGADINDLKQKISSMLPTSKPTVPQLVREMSFDQGDERIRQMERVHTEFNKEVLEDITEESEKHSDMQKSDKLSNNFDSIISLKMMQMLEGDGKSIQEINKDVGLNIDAAQRRELYVNVESRDSLKELPPSGRDSCSLATTSTEYKTLQEEYGGIKILDFHTEIATRDELISKLKESLTKSMEHREKLEKQSEKLCNEVEQLRKQLTETIEENKKSLWRDQESTGQRLSEISIDLVSGSEEDLDRHFLTDNEEKMAPSNRNSRERQLGGSTNNILDAFDPGFMPISKQIEQFSKYLNNEESRIFFMIQKKFDDFLSEEIEKTKMKYENEMKLLTEQLEIEKDEKDTEISRLRELLTSIKNGSTELIQLRQELENKHAHEMEDLRTYFEKKCADLEKQYSEEIFSQKSQHNSNDTNSDFSDQEHMQDDNAIRSKESSPRKRTREELYASPSHRQITPTTLSQTKDELAAIGPNGDCKAQEMEPQITIEELKTFYQEKIDEIKQQHEEVVKKLNDKLKRFEVKYAEDEFMTQSENKVLDENASYLIIDKDEDFNESQEIRKIAAEYEKRLKEQVALAKEDILLELGNQIQALVSESTADDQHWPPELILLREKFTAKSHLEIAQLQIKHEEEMSRLKAEYERQLNRKLKRNSTFDLSRDLDQIINEREKMRELTTTFRALLSDLIKCVSVCEDDFNNTLLEELHKFGIYQQNQSFADDNGNDNDNNTLTLMNASTQSNQLLQTTLSKKVRVVPDTSGLLSIIEDPRLIEYINEKDVNSTSFDLQECLMRLKTEADYLLELSEDLCKKKKQNEVLREKNDSGEEEDGLKSTNRSPQKVLRASSFNENLLRDKQQQGHRGLHLSLPPDLTRISLCQESVIEIEAYPSTEPTSELSSQVRELTNRLVKSENNRRILQQELEATIKKNYELGVELSALKTQLEQFDSQREDYSEGYGLGELKSPQRGRSAKGSTSFSQLQEKARNILSTPTKMSENTSLLLQMIEDFCREGEKVIEESKKNRDDLQAQIVVADKQLKATRQFLNEQAAEREFEREEFIKEIEKLKAQIQEKEKERTSFEIASKEAEQMEMQIKDLTEQVSELQAKKDKNVVELKASIDKIFVLREIISELETQVQTKALNEHVLNEKVKELESFIASQARANEALQQEVESLKSEVGQGYQEKIAHLEEQLKNSRPSAEQSLILEQITEQLRDIETTLDQKTKTLESLHQSVCSASCSTSPTEDVSVQAHIKAATTNVTPIGSPIHASPRHHSLPIEEVQRVFEKLSKHTRVEEAAIKRIRDLEMQVCNIRTTYAELQNERDILQERMSEQLLRISSLQSKLEEQRRRAEEIQRQGTSDLNIRIHDLQNEVQNLKEILSARDKQILNLKNHLEQSKAIIDRQEAELALGIQADRSVVDKLEAELRTKNEENKKLKDKIKNEMINRLALPDLMETMLADKNEEIDHLKEQLESKEKELQGILEINLSQANNNSSNDKEKTKAESEVKLSARTLSDIVSFSEYDEPEAIRRAPVEAATPLVLPQTAVPEQTMGSSKQSTGNLGEKRPEDLSNPKKPSSLLTQSFENPLYFQGSSCRMEGAQTATPSFIPRHINFSEFADSTPKIQEIFDDEDIKSLKEKLQAAEGKVENLKISLENLESEKNKEISRLRAELIEKTRLYDMVLAEKKDLEEKLEALQSQVAKNDDVKAELEQKKIELTQLGSELKGSRTQSEQFENELKMKYSEIEDLKSVINKLTSENESLLRRISCDMNSAQQINNLKEKVDILNKIINEKDEILTKQEKNLINLQQSEKTHLERIAELENQVENFVNNDRVDTIERELESVRTELTEKVILYEKCMLDTKTYQEEIDTLKHIISEKDSIINSIQTEIKSLQQAIVNAQNNLGNTNSLNELRRKLREEQERCTALQQKNVLLESELEKLRSQNSDTSKPFSLDEIAEQVEKELNYSAQLDSNILKAIESEEENNPNKVDNEKQTIKDLQNQIKDLKSQWEAEKTNSVKYQQMLNLEKQRSQEIQKQDADIIEALRIRLEEALEKEEQFTKMLDKEREKCERLATQIAVFQRSEARKSSLLLKSPPDSPRKSPRSSDFESELAERLKNEIKLLTAQNEREKERVTDLQKVLEREKSRFDTELNDRIDYADKLKREMDKLSRDKELADQEVEHLQERLSLASREIESLEKRIAMFQEAETRRAQRRDKERAETTQNAVELQDLKAKVITLEAERDHLNQTINLLRDDIDRGAQREAKLAEELAKAGGDASLPQQFLQKMKEMKDLLAENSKESRQMTDTIQYLIEERKALQKRVEELESDTRGQSYTELEERANHLFGKYLRVESHRKALVHQKRYLLILVRTYEENESRALALMNKAVEKRPKRNLFKSVALVIVAIQRMKFIVKRWHTGKRLVSKSIFNLQMQKRPSTISGPSLSPPCRDTSYPKGFSLVDNTIKPLQAPGLISECSQKFDWSRLKK